MVREVYPRVSVDCQLGELVDDISVDFDQLVALMRERGFTDEQIEKTKILIRGTTPSTNVRHESGEKMVPTGGYDALLREISLYPREQIEKTVNEIQNGSFSDNAPCAGGGNLSSEFSMALVHELEHHAAETLEGGRTLSKGEYIAMGKSAIKLMVSFPVLFSGAERGWNAAMQQTNYDPGSTANSIAALGSAAIACVGAFLFARPWEMSYSQYRSSYAELKSNEVERGAPTNLVVIRPRVRSGDKGMQASGAD